MNLQSTPDIKQLIRADFVALLADAIDTATVHAQWVAIRTYSFVPPRPPEPLTRRRLLRHNAVEAWQTMQDGLAALRPACQVKCNSLSCELHWLFVRPRKRGS